MSPPDQNAPAAPLSPAPLPVILPENLIVIHYHRFDARLDAVTLWTWDEATHQTPPDNELLPCGRDDFGAIFHLDRARFEGSKLIGLLPRTDRDWGQRDGVEKHWKPADGPEIWIVQTRAEIYREEPILLPQISAAFLDARQRIGILLATPVDGSQLKPADFWIVDARGKRQPVEEVHYFNAASMRLAFALQVTFREALDATATYAVSVANFAGTALTKLRGLLDDRELFYDADLPLGALYTPAETTFRLFAPTVFAVEVVLYQAAAGAAGRTLHALSPAGKGFWETTLTGDLAGHFYRFAVTSQAGQPARETLDPYATNTVNSATRARITDLTKTHPPGWETLRRGPTVDWPSDCVIYEIHVRDFTIAANSGIARKGLYAGFAEAGTRLKGDPQIATALDHLVELGVTHVQLLPVHDFLNDEREFEYNWGYVSTVFCSPDGVYATEPGDDSRIRELKQLIAALHARGLGVILDVVYNHTAQDAPFLQIAPEYYYRHWPDGSLSNGSGVGNDFRTEGPMVRRHVLDSLKFWMTEYGIDGFRFDLMGLIDAATMREVELALRKIKPDVLIYGEPWRAADSPMPLPMDKQGVRGTGVGCFNDDFRNGLKGSPDGEGAGFIQKGWNSDAVRQGIAAGGWSEGPWQTINYMTCHDNMVLYDKLKVSMPGASEKLLLATMRLGYVILFTAQGVPFLHGGEEFARTKFGHHNSYNAPDEINQVDWSLKKKHRALLQCVKDLIAMRKAHPLFRLRTREETNRRLRFSETGNWRTLQYVIAGDGLAGETWARCCVVLNSDDTAAQTFKLPAGRWTLAFDGAKALPLEGAPTYEGKVRVLAKTGCILFADALQPAPGSIGVPPVG